MSGLTSERNFRLLLFHHSRCTTTHNGRVKPVKSPTVTCLCACVYNNFIYYMYIARENKPKSVYICGSAPNVMFLVIFSTYIFITIIIIFSRFEKRIINTFLNRIWNFCPERRHKSAENGLSCALPPGVRNTPRVRVYIDAGLTFGNISAEPEGYCVYAGDRKKGCRNK